MKKLFLFVAAVLLCAGCGRKAAQEAKLEAFPVRAEAASRRTLEETLSLVGSLKATNEATLFSRVPGKLLKFLVKEGDPVKKGDTVALVERDEVGVEFKPAPVPSTLDGILARDYLDQGANVKTDTPVALIIQSGGIIAKADVPERQAARVAVGQAVHAEFEAYPGRKFTGKVSRVSPAVDPATRALPIEVSLEGAEGVLKSGMFGHLSVVLSRRSGALSVPVSALSDADVPSVFVVEDGKAFRRAVETGLTTEDYVEIRSGLKEGEQVVTFGLFALKDGSPVEPMAESGAR